MASALGIILIAGVIANLIAVKLRLPGLLGMILAGIVLGPHCTAVLSAETTAELGDFRKIALVIILLRAGLGLKKEALAQVGSSAVKMSFIPGILEASVIAGAASVLFGFTLIEGFLLGSILSAVSPAVVVPKMLSLAEQGRGGKVPALILAGASADNVIAVTLFSSVLAAALGIGKSAGAVLVSIPLSIFSGIVLGIITGAVLVLLFSRCSFRDSNKVIILLGTAFLMTALQDALRGSFEIASLLGIMTAGIILLEKIPEKANRIALKLSKLWIAAEILVFVLIGAAADPVSALEVGVSGVIIIALGAAARSAGVLLSLIGTEFTPGQRLFAVVSYLPKASVQAALGAVPLEMGLASGKTILAASILSILITAPLGASLMNLLAPKLLKQQLT